jgi:hypothetical protein
MLIPALKLILGTHLFYTSTFGFLTVDLILSLSTVSSSITHTQSAQAGAITAHKLIYITGGGCAVAAILVRHVSTIILTVAFPNRIDAQLIITLKLLI